MREEIRVFGQNTDTHQPFRVIMAGASYCDRTYRVNRPDYDYFVIEHVTGGEGVLETGGNRYVLRAGDTYFLHRGKGHRYYCTGNFWNKLWVVVDGPLAQLLADSYLPHHPDVLPGFDIRGSMEKVLQLAFDTTLPYDELCRQAALAVHKLLTAAAVYGTQDSQPLHQAVKRRIEEQTEGPLRLEELARELNYSKNHIINVFRTAYGVTPYAYFLQQRLRSGRELLLGTSLPVCDIARKLGFDSPQYFSRCFRKQFGVNPAQLRGRKN